MNKIKYRVLIATMVPISAMASYNYTGNFNYNARVIEGEDQAAAATKYDPQKTFFGSFGAIMGNEHREFMVTGKDLATSNQEYSISGRHFNLAKYSLTYSELNHRVSNGASVGLTGTGGTDLTYGGLAANYSADPSNWEKFDFEVEKTEVGIDAVTNIGEKFYFGFSAHRFEYDGIRPQGFMAVSSATKLTEYGEAFKMDTNIVEANFGYKGEKSAIALKGYLSKQTPEADKTTIKDPHSNNMIDESTIFPESNFYKITLEGTLFDLPFNSIFSFDANMTRTWNDLYMDPYVTMSTSGATRYLTYTAPVFEGDIKSQNVKMNLKTRWTDKLSSRLFARYFFRDNKSTVITATADQSPGNYRVDAMTNNPFEFGRESAGLALDYKLPAQTSVLTDLEYLNTRRNGRRSDVDENTDYSAQIEFLNRYFSQITPRAKYTYLERTSEFMAAQKGLQINANTGAPGTGIATYEFLRRRDVNDKTMHKGDIGADAVLFESIKYGTADLSLSTGYVRNNYKYVVVGRTNDTRFIVDSNFLYHLRDVVKVNLYGFLEKNTEDSAFGTSDAARPTNYTAVNLQDKVITYGIDVMIPVLEEKLDVKLGFAKYKSDGVIDFVNLDNGTTNRISENDDYTSQTLTARIDYYWNQNFSLATGYRHEEFDYRDVRINGYNQVPTTSLYYAGAYRDRNFNVNEGWLGATYKF